MRLSYLAARGDHDPRDSAEIMVRNRLIMAPMGNRLAKENAGVTPWLID